jgi:DNA modification methylase
VQCVITSPPYFSLRDYGTGTWDGGNADCDHAPVSGIQGTTGQRADRAFTGSAPQRGRCTRCGATRIDQQIGLEATPEAFIEKMVTVFREVRRVLRDDGTCWLNIGDSYNGSGGAGGDYGEGGLKEGQPRYPGRHIGGDLKPKDLIGVPWMLAFALRADGWYLRSDIIWSKPNPMPESVTDRPSKAHEYIFLLTKSARYFYDAEAVREKFADERMGNPGGGGHYAANIPGQRPHGGLSKGEWNVDGAATGRNRRTVWTIPTQSYEGAHFATFPEKLVEPCILAGTSQRGACPHCGAPWRRLVDKRYLSPIITTGTEEGRYDKGRNRNVTRMGDGVDVTTTGWQQECACPAAEPVPCTVLEPFAGSGTTLMVAKRLVRRSVGIDLSADYLALAVERIKSAEPGIQLDMMSAWGEGVTA